MTSVVLPSSPLSPSSPSPSSPSSPPPLPSLESLFTHDRLLGSSLLLFLFAPFSLFLLTLRIFLGFHAFVVACLLRKANVLRSIVLRVMCALCGIVVTSSNRPDPSCRMLVANHVSYVDHLAIDLLQPCALASVWDIPNLLRWCFGYIDLGAREGGRQELVKRAKNYIESEDHCLLSFPESALTSGQVGLLRFATWPFEVSSRIQPVSIRVSRPLFAVSVTVLGSAWWQDLLFFLLLPFTRIHVNWLPVMIREANESTESFALRVSKEVARDVNVIVTEYTSHDAVEAAKRHVIARQAMAASKSRPRVKLDSRKLDEAAMTIKQGHPSIPVVDIRKDLEKTNNPQLTIERIKSGLLKPSSVSNKKISTASTLSDPTEWRRLFAERKWQMIELNRAKYLEKATRVSKGEKGDS